MDDFHRLSRRAFVRCGSLFLLAAATTDLRAAEEQSRKVRIGLVTDLHHADKPAVTMMLLDATAPDKPAAKANETVRPSDIPITMSQTLSEAVNPSYSPAA